MMGLSLSTDERERVDEEDGDEHDAHEEARDVGATGGTVHEVGRKDGELGSLLKGGAVVVNGILVLKGEYREERELP